MAEIFSLLNRSATKYAGLLCLKRNYHFAKKAVSLPRHLAVRFYYQRIFCLRLLIAPLVFFSFVFSLNPALALETLDSFENPLLPGWEITNGRSGVTTAQDYYFDGAFSLKLRKPSTSEYILMKKSLALVTNKRFSIRYFDNLDIAKGTYFGVRNSANNQYYMIGARTDYSGTNPNTYFFRYSGTDGKILFFDSGIKRSFGWHLWEIVVTEIGTYAKIDGFNTAYLGTVENNQYRPLNNSLTAVDTIEIASTWQAVSTDYYDYLSQEDIASYTTVDQAVAARLKNFVQTYWGKFIGPQSFTVSDYALFEAQLARTGANFSFSLTVLCLKENNPDLCNHSLTLAKTIKDSYYHANNQWKAVNSTDRNFKYRPSSLTLTPLVWVVWLNNDRLSYSDYEDYRKMFAQEADWFVGHDLSVELPSSSGNSSSETLAWTAAYLITAGKAFGQPGWLAMGDKLINAGLSEDFVGSGYRLFNHGFFHPGYALYTIGSVAEAGLSYRFLNEVLPSFWKTGLVNLYKGSVQDYVAWQSRYFYLNFIHGVDDWHRTPVDTGISAFTLLEYFQEGFNDSLAKYIWFSANDYWVFPEVSGIETAFQTQDYQVNLDPPAFVNLSLNDFSYRMLVNSTVALYDGVTFLWETGRRVGGLIKPPLRPGDVNGDGKIDFDDLKHILDTWLSDGVFANLWPDVYKDSKVNSFDFSQTVFFLTGS